MAEDGVREIRNANIEILNSAPQESRRKRNPEAGQARMLKAQKPKTMSRMVPALRGFWKLGLSDFEFV